LSGEKCKNIKKTGKEAYQAIADEMETKERGEILYKRKNQRGVWVSGGVSLALYSILDHWSKGHELKVGKGAGAVFQGSA